MGDKPKDKSKDGVSAMLVACGTQTDPSSRSISAAIIADNLAGGAKGAAAITNNTRGITESVGSCVANYYDDKKPSAWDKLTAQIGSLSNAFSSAADASKAAVVEGVKVAAPEVTNAVTNGSVNTIRTYKANQEAASNNM